ncbi:hypothetical protein A7Q26_04920 [Sphingobium sp. TCM1]|uniref:Uncharacterized protein n=1 Tax=Sphingomonas sanxanigenens DSM 19645 = NX02 TaxID=1123269 RepID=W0ABA0_9SPHN|nr:hypothetical protein NX02_09285 [Sphingomonas sanxanigenens DSM 19645 = NX02]OAN53373.1 hypothetical protein A7Q26_04920 [Sphingobium sp. TCM1]
MRAIDRPDWHDVGQHRAAKDLACTIDDVSQIAYASLALRMFMLFQGKVATIRSRSETDPAMILGRLDAVLEGQRQSARIG